MFFKRRSISAAILAGTALLSTTTAVAQEINEGTIEEIQVTGSYIKSTPGDAALPVQVLNRDYIDGIGAISVADVIGKLAISSGAENQTDSFTQGSTQGTANVNLRGLGLSSTLVLINGRRQTISGALANDGSVFVDTSSIPITALERVEVLKEGAASTYGSDAIAGVVNFILRKDFDGFELSTNLSSVDRGDQEDQSVGFIWGGGNDTTRFTVAGNIIDRTSLGASDRPELVDNARSSLGASFVAMPHLAGMASVTLDSGPYAGTYGPGQRFAIDGCAGLEGGSVVPTPAGPMCFFQYGTRFNLVAAEERTQLYANMTHEMANGVEMTAELGYASNKVTENPQSPSYPDLTFPLISGDHPSNDLGVPLVWLGRPLAFDYPSPNAPRQNDTLRASLSFKGELSNSWAWDAALTRSSNEYSARQPDTKSSRLRAGLAGVGGPTNNEYYDPFVSSNNSAALIADMSYLTDTQRTTDLTVADAVVSGELMTLASGATVDFAAGIQVRREGYKTETDDLYEIKFDANGNPIPIDLIFLGGVSEIDISRTGVSAFAEAKTALSDNVELTAALRYEDLDSGSSVDPKLALRWQLSDQWALRASASTAFREPSLSQINAQVVNLEGIQDFNADGSANGGVAFVRVTSSGSEDLQAEESDNFNVGLIFQPSDDLDFKLDYWVVDYTNLITVENAQGKVAADINGADVIRSDTGTLAGVLVDYFNSSSVDVSGIDLEVNWALNENWNMGLNIAHFLEYDITLPTGDVVDAVGYLNNNNFARSMPATKANLNVAWTNGAQNASLNVHHITDYQHSQTVPATESQSIDSYTTVDGQYGITMAAGADDGELMLSVGVKNMFDEKPPRVYDSANYSFDSKQHSPLGRVYYVKANYSF
ncbi:MAG: TonB-dependent receptor [Porticoccaceae bacterium]|nr:TonB-dependent receptor [Porticoccaceae bacterium]MDG1312036.1 TonB-dependent receptor [Porticoccaceae bacterium]